MKASQRSEVDPFIVMDVMEAARAAEAAGRHIIHMEVGQPGTPAPAAARVELARAMEADALGYTVALGLPALRARIARLYRDWHGIDLNPERVVVTAGASGAFILAFTALFDTGDRVGIGGGEESADVQGDVQPQVVVSGDRWRDLQRDTGLLLRADARLRGRGALVGRRSGSNLL